MAPIVKMHTLGHDFVPDPIHAGGLRYHGMAPQVSLLKDQGVIEARAVPSGRTFEAGRHLRPAEGILPAPEPTHAISVVIDEARKATEEGRSPVILFNLCGHGHFDLTAYERYLAGELERSRAATGAHRARPGDRAGGVTTGRREARRARI